jgi:hypothetical protein
MMGEMKQSKVQATTGSAEEAMELPMPAVDGAGNRGASVGPPESEKRKQKQNGSRIVRARKWWYSLEMGHRLKVISLILALLGICGTLGAPIVEKSLEFLVKGSWKPMLTLTPTYTPTATPTPMSTSTPTPTNTPTPTSPPTDTPTSTPTPTNTPTPCPTPVYFQSIWETHPELGNPTECSTSDFTFQEFEGGLLIWRKSPTPATIYALYYHSGRWETQTDPGGPPVPSCSEAENTGLGPIFSFGTLWCEPWNWKAKLGWPLEREQDGGNNLIQVFENGTVFTVGPAGEFILYSDSSWERFQ